MSLTRCLLVLFSLFVVSNAAFADDEPFTYPMNGGGTGLLEVPTARVMRENSYRFGVSQVYPYRYYYVALSPFKGLEISGKITEVLSFQVGQEPGAFFQGYGNWKDKSFDLKYQIFSEGKYMPAVALGLMDPHGTRIYASQYLVMSKQIYPFDFTIGLGNGRFGEKQLASQGDGLKIEMFSSPQQWLEESQIFGGVQFAPSEKYALMIEYSPIKYEKQTNDPASNTYFNHNPIKSHFNIGVRWKPLKWAELDVSYQRGNEIGLNLSMNFDIGKPLIPIYDKPYKENPAVRANTLQDRLATALNDSGFSDIGIDVSEDMLTIAAQNDKFFYNTKALAVIVKIIEDILPDQMRRVYIVLRNNGIPIFEFSTSREDIKDLFAEKLTWNEFYYISQIKTGITETLTGKTYFRKPFDYGIKQSLNTFLNDPSGFFKYRLGLSGWVKYDPWKGASFIAGFEAYPINTVSTVNEPLSIPVRTDYVDYLDNTAALSRLMYEQLFKMPLETYGKISTGLLEVEYAGLDAEVAMPLFSGRLMVGASGSLVKKRDPDNIFKLKSTDFKTKDYYSTAFFNTRLNIPEQEFSIELKIGRFLAGDTGTRITLSKFIGGVVLSAWYSVTDTSIFKDNLNRGYHDKGIAISIPLRLFKGSDTKTSYSYALSPWTRDVAQDIDHTTSLFDYIGRNSAIYLDKDKKMMY